MDLGSIIFIVLGVAFVLLIVLAIRKMAAGGAADQAPDKRTDKPTKPGDKKPGRSAEPGVDRADEKQRLSRGLAKTRGGFIARLTNLFSGKSELSEEMLEQVEEILFTADIGVQTSQQLIDDLRSSLDRGEVNDATAVWQRIRATSRELLEGQGSHRTLDVSSAQPFVILVIGVNGTGKTTTIGKLAARYKAQGLKVMLAAGDTFRAAAVEQLEVWGERAGCPVVRGKENADPTSVVVEALKRAQDEGVDLLIADTAGRLHTQHDLMDELQKVGRSLDKRMRGAPHETVLVLDSTTGQNAIAQARKFKEAMSITGLVLTKLDGTAKGGVVLGICNELGLPVRFIGIGEKIEDLRAFDAELFVDALYEGASATEDDA